MALIAGNSRRAGDPGVANDQFLTAELNHFIVAGAAGTHLTDSDIIQMAHLMKVNKQYWHCCSC